MNYQAYELAKQRLRALNLEPEEYEQALKLAVEILEKRESEE